MPTATEIVAVTAIVWVLSGRHRRPRATALGSATVIGSALSLGARAALTNAGLSGEAPPWRLWAWTFATGFAVGVVIFGWRLGSGWWRHDAVFAAAMCLLSTGLVINGWIGYFPTAAVAWQQLTDQPLPHQIDTSTAFAMRSRGQRPPDGRIVGIQTGRQVSGFEHRTEWVYLPPNWFRGPNVALPIVMMIAGEFSTPADWVRAGDAAATADSYARTHNGIAPVLVFADANGTFSNDTECVNGIRGRAADHLTREVVPAVVRRFDAVTAPRRWAVAGFSSGGTCAVDLAVMHPEIFGRFADIAGDERPNAGTEAQTVARLFGGDRRAWDAFDPATVIARHGAYRDTAGLFVVPKSSVDSKAAQRLCGLGQGQGIRCSITTLAGRHTWPFASSAFETALPWLVEARDAGATPDVS